MTLGFSVVAGMVLSYLVMLLVICHNNERGIKILWKG